MTAAKNFNETSNVKVASGVTLQHDRQGEHIYRQHTSEDPAGVAVCVGVSLKNDCIEVSDAPKSLCECECATVSAC